MAVMRARWIVLAVLLGVLDAYLLLFRWADVAGNVEAQVILVTPAFVAHHVLTRRHLDRIHAETQERLDAQDAAFEATHNRVRELHDLHIGLRLPDRELKPE